MSKVVKKAYVEEAVEGYNLRTAREEARRCLLCHDAPCSKSCPAGTDPGKFIRSVRFNNVKGAAETIRQNNPFGGSCANVCPYDQLCQEACSRCGIDKPIEIGKIQRFVVEQEQMFGMETMEVTDKKSEKVACIGAGPASLTVAAVLAQAGYSVTVFDREKAAGGMLTYGILPARLPQSTVDYDIDLIRKLGVSFVMNRTVQSADELKKEGFDAVFAGIGMWGEKTVDIPGAQAKGVYSALSYLKEARESGGRFKPGKQVVVIGGGDVAMDCAATAKLAGAEKVMIYYRRTIEEAPANIEEVKYVQSMGITITTDFSPEKIITDHEAASFISFKGRDNVSSATVKADTIIFAIGQAPDSVEGIGQKGVFAGGDMANGGKTVVEAVAEGKEAAALIMDYLEKKAGEK